MRSSPRHARRYQTVTMITQTGTQTTTPYSPAAAPHDFAERPGVTTARQLRRDPRVPRRAKVAVAIAALWMLSPIDLIPEFVPVIGPLDDIIVVALLLRYAARSVPRVVLLEAWPGNPTYSSA